MKNATIEDYKNLLYQSNDDEEEEYHPYDCTCENCLQNHPERDILYGNGEYFDWGDDDGQLDEDNN